MIRKIGYLAFFLSVRSGYGWLDSEILIVIARNEAIFKLYRAKRKVKNLQSRPAHVEIASCLAMTVGEKSFLSQTDGQTITTTSL